MFEIFQSLVDRSFASSVVNSCFAYNIFLVPFVKCKWSQVSFVAGQPLGYYFSWPLFAFKNILWCGGQHNWCTLVSTFVTMQCWVMRLSSPMQRWRLSMRLCWGLSILKWKSLISNTGCIEFAKRFKVNGGRDDLSPILICCLANYLHPKGLFAIRTKYSVKPFSTLCRIGGLGYKSLGRIDHSLSLTTSRRRAMWDRTLFPLELWLGRGRPLNPYLRSALVHYLLRELKQKDLPVVPDNFFEPCIGLSFESFCFPLTRDAAESFYRTEIHHGKGISTCMT